MDYTPPSVGVVRLVSKKDRRTIIQSIEGRRQAGISSNKKTNPVAWADLGFVTLNLGGDSFYGLGFEYYSARPVFLPSLRQFLGGLGVCLHLFHVDGDDGRYDAAHDITLAHHHALPGSSPYKVILPHFIFYHGLFNHLGRLQCGCYLATMGAVQVANTHA